MFKYAIVECREAWNVCVGVRTADRVPLPPPFVELVLMRTPM